MLRFDVINKSEKDLETEILTYIESCHQNGPVDPFIFEFFALCKYFRKDVFCKFEKEILFVIGLFYKTEEPQSVLSLFYSSFKEEIESVEKKIFTPVQYEIKQEIQDNTVYSFSAPTSVGKTFLLKTLLENGKSDSIVVVPTRALLAEYLFELQNLFKDRKDFFISDFVDDVNKGKTSRHIFLLTPERMTEIFKSKYNFNVEMIVFDEAQVSDDLNRGVIFEYVVKKCCEKYPNAKKVFTHPAIENPNAQIVKFGLDGKSNFFNQQTAGKIFLWKKSADDFYLFDPYGMECHKQKNMVQFKEDFFENFLKNNKKILFFVSKRSIVESSIEKTYDKYIQLCEKITDKNALFLIEQIKDLLNIQKGVHSSMICLLERGIVIHHGSIPLNIRYLLEEFMKRGFARICFSTSTLLHGVNMPFDIVALESFRFFGSEDEKSLGLKNLIGRAGRTSKNTSGFDYGFVVVSTVKSFCSRLNRSSKLSCVSVLNQSVDKSEDVKKENILALKENFFNQEYVEPESRIDRLKKCFAVEKNYIKIILAYVDMPNSNEKESLKNDYENAWIKIYEAYINRCMTDVEKKVFALGFRLLSWVMEGKGFKEILAIRYDFLKKDGLDRVKYSPIPIQLPNIALKKLPPAFDGKFVDYDVLVYDTYDYLDKVVELSLMPAFVKTFELYYASSSDQRAEKMIKRLKYGTFDDIEILLKRYGFSSDEIPFVKQFVDTISEEKIVFKNLNIDEMQNLMLKNKIERYM